MPFNQSGGGGAGPGSPGFEINYTQVTAPVNVTDTLEATATALISPGAITFDGSPVICEFFTANLIPPNAAAGNETIITLFEGATQITRLAIARCVVTTSTVQACAHTFYRFTPTVGSHTYKICGFVPNTTGTPGIDAGPGGTAGQCPAFVRFIKV